MFAAGNQPLAPGLNAPRRRWNDFVAMAPFFGSLKVGELLWTIHLKKKFKYSLYGNPIPHIQDIQIPSSRWDTWHDGLPKNNCRRLVLSADQKGIGTRNKFGGYCNRVFGVQTGSHCFFLTSWYPQIPKGWLWTELWILKVNGSGSKWPPKLEGNFLLPTFLRVRPKWYQLNHRNDDRLKTEHGEHRQNKMKQDEATWDK